MHTYDKNVYSCPVGELVLQSFLESLFCEMKKIVILKSAMKMADESLLFIERCGTIIIIN